MDLIVAMRCFVRVYESGSFSVAARHLALGQPAVSKSIAQLEAMLGVRLFLRSTRGLAPTDAARTFHEHAVRTLDEAEQALKAVRGEPAALTGRLRVGGTITFMRQHVIPQLSRFLDAHQGLELDLLLDDGNVGLVGEGRGGAKDGQAAQFRPGRPPDQGWRGARYRARASAAYQCAGGGRSAVLPGGRRAGPKARAFIAFVEQLLATTRYAVNTTETGP